MKHASNTAYFCTTVETVIIAIYKIGQREHKSCQLSKFMVCKTTKIFQILPLQTFGT